MSLPVTVGTISLALGAMSGWPVAMLADGGAVGRLRLREPRRLLQLHLDWVLMGILLLAVAAAVPDLPRWAGALVTVGAVGNPLLFLPLAFGGATVRRRPAYRLAALVSFAALSVGLVAVAVAAAA